MIIGHSECAGSQPACTGLQVGQVFPDESAGQWYVLHTKSRQEKALAQTLEASGVAYFLPLVTRTRFYGRRKATVVMPLFPSYVFLRGELEDAYFADRTKRWRASSPWRTRRRSTASCGISVWR